eukprot:m.88484 g.88484  ORF g.88484 m.88484 type:complete len:289 (+) comp19989_c0_seq1:57-923(+)
MSAADLHDAEALRDALTKAVADKPMDNEHTMSILNRISELAITEAILTKTRLGKVVNLARKRPGVSPEAQALAKKLAREYKAVMDKAGPAKAVIGGGDGRPLSAGAVTTVKPERSVATVQHAAVTMNVEQVGDPVRNAMRKVLCQALCTKGRHKAAPEVAVAIENAVFRTSGYPAGKGKIRGIVSNLKKNADLREQALSKAIPGEKFAIMTADDLASDKVKATKAAANEQYLKDKALAIKEGAHTTEYPCPKCKVRDCIYTQLQTRSADEPMTTFCACKQCGNRWKFC